MVAIDRRQVHSRLEQLTHLILYTVIFEAFCSNFSSTLLNLYEIEVYGPTSAHLSSGDPIDPNMCMFGYNQGK
jgi:hypothetical protein